jgi:alpha-tubulin suppressor-like RCC1 family protein
LCNQFTGIVPLLALLAIGRSTAFGAVVAWGANDVGQTDVPPNVTNVVAMAARSDHSLALRADGSMVSWGSNYSGEGRVPFIPGGATFIAAVPGDEAAVTENGTVIYWGSWLGYVSIEPTNVIALAVGGFRYVALKSDGGVTQSITPGNSNLYIPASLTNIVAVAAGDEFSLILNADGQVFSYGLNPFGQVSLPPGLSNVVAIAAGAQHALALKADGTVMMARSWPGATIAQARLRCQAA